MRLLGALLAVVAAACGPTPNSAGALGRAGTADEQADAGQVAAPTPGPSWTVRTVSIEIERQPDGTRYVSFVRERYELESGSSLRYFAYFGGMPIEMNHTDGLEWDAGASGRAVLDAVAAILADPERRAELVEGAQGRRSGLLEAVRARAPTPRGERGKQGRLGGVGTVDSGRRSPQQVSVTRATTSSTRSAPPPSRTTTATPLVRKKVGGRGILARDERRGLGANPSGDPGAPQHLRRMVRCFFGPMLLESPRRVGPR